MNDERKESQKLTSDSKEGVGELSVSKTEETVQSEVDKNTETEDGTLDNLKAETSVESPDRTVLPELPKSGAANTSSKSGVPPFEKSADERGPIPDFDSRKDKDSDSHFKKLKIKIKSKNSDQTGSDTITNPSESGPDKNDKNGKLGALLEDRRVTIGSIAIGVLLLGGICYTYSQQIGLQSQLENRENTITENNKTIYNLETKNKDLEKQVDKLETQVDDLESQLDEAVNGPNRMLELVEAASDEKDWSETITAADALHNKYPGTEADKKGQTLKQTANSEIKKAEEAKKQKEEEEKRKKAEEEAKGYETGITYRQLARYPEKYIGKKVKFSGRVVQSMKSGNSYTIRLAVDDDYDNIILATYDGSITKGKVLEDDNITIYGTSGGDHTYESIMGSSITVPLVFIDKIDQ